eukprot:gene52040-69633_t
MADKDNQGQEESVRVFVRIRPLNKREIAEKQTIGWNFNETSMLEDTPMVKRATCTIIVLGKTWTMRGCESDPGMMVLCIRDILEWVKSHSQTVYTLKVAYME